MYPYLSQMGLIKKLKFNPARQLLALVLLTNTLAFSANSEPIQCRPQIDPSLPQFIIGYGSLMQEASKREDDPKSGNNYPIYVTGFKRGWIERGTTIGFSTTYLGVKPEANAKMNAVYFQLDAAKAIANYDKREDTYCRISVARENIQFLTPNPPQKGQYWIYTLNPNEKDQPPTSETPIVQSYVDIFLSGCFQLEEKYNLKNFARDCIRTTSNWSGAWVNDRLYPRTAFDNIPYVAKIDPLIANELPDYFKAIRIE